MIEKQKAQLRNENDEEKFLVFQEMAQNLEGKAKDDENLVPNRIIKQVKREKEREKVKKQLDEKDKQFSFTVEESAVNGPTLPAITHENREAIPEIENGHQFTQYTITNVSM